MSDEKIQVTNTLTIGRSVPQASITIVVPPNIHLLYLHFYPLPTMSAYKSLLNMENHDPINRLVRELTDKILQNEAIIANISRSMDTKLTLPFEQAPTNDNPIENDHLRVLLDKKYLPQIELELFSEVKNPRLRQLLVDNKALSELHKAKIQQNKSLYQVYSDYEQLIHVVVLPQLTKVVCEYNLEKIADLRDNKLEEKLAADSAVWKLYSEYVANLDKIYGVVSAMLEALEQVVDRKEVERLEQQLMIVERLANVARKRQLTRPVKG